MKDRVLLIVNRLEEIIDRYQNPIRRCQELHTVALLFVFQTVRSLMT